MNWVKGDIGRIYTLNEFLVETVEREGEEKKFHLSQLECECSFWWMLCLLIILLFSFTKERGWWWRKDEASISREERGKKKKKNIFTSWTFWRPISSQEVLIPSQCDQPLIKWMANSHIYLLSTPHLLLTIFIFDFFSSSFSSDLHHFHRAIIFLISIFVLSFTSLFLISK